MKATPPMDEILFLSKSGLGWLTDEHLIEYDWARGRVLLEDARKVRARTGQPGYYWLRRGEVMDFDEELRVLAWCAMVSRIVWDATRRAA